MKKFGILVFALVFVALILVGLTLIKGNGKSGSESKIAKTAPPIAKTEFQNQTPVPSPENKLCDWVDKSDIIIELSFAEGVTKDSSYEAGFYYSAIGSTMRLARTACNYRTGFSYSEMKNKGSVQVGVRGYTDSNRRQLENEPINVIFDEDGKPSLPSPIRVKVLN